MHTAARPVWIPSLVALLALAGCGAGWGGAAAAAASAAVTSAAPSTPLPPSSASGSRGAGGPPGTFDRTYGGREYWLFVPTTQARPLPLAILFHGAGDSATNFWTTARAAGWEAAAQDLGVVLVVPETRSPLRDFAVWSGNPANDVSRMQTELASVLELVRRDVEPRYDVDPRSLHALGFSDGGLFVAATGLASPAFATSTILGYGWGPAYVTQPADRRPVHMACGTLGPFFAAATQSEAFLRAQGHAVRWEAVPGVGHSFLGLSAAIGPRACLAWMTAHPAGLPGAAAPAPGPPAPGPPAPAAGGAARGSGGSGGGVGLRTRRVTTQAQPGLPPIALDYTLYVPTGYTPAAPAPLVLAANMGLAPWQALAEREGVIVVDFRDHDRDGGFDLGYDVAFLNAVLRDVEGAWNVDTRRVYLHGFSAGAHWGYAVALANPRVFAALGVNAGSMGFAIQLGVWPPSGGRELPVAIRQGTQDPLVPVQVARQDRDRLRAAGNPVQYEEFPGGHTVSAQDAAAVWRFFARERLP